MTKKAARKPQEAISAPEGASPAQDAGNAPGGRLAANPCPNCGQRFPRGTRGSPKLFCGQDCRKAFHKRQARRGEALAAFVLAWRGKRGSGPGAKAAFAELCSIADLFNAEDREAGRPPMVDYTSAVLREGRYIDRKCP